MITARWRDIAVLSWPIDDDLLVPSLPAGLELDHWNGAAYVSLVCLVMENLRVFRLPALVRNLAEVNLRFYVRPVDARSDRKGVVFLRQLVSNHLFALTARRLFREPMLGTPVSHECELADPVCGRVRRRLQYRWRNRNRYEGLRITGSGETRYAEPDSLDEFLTARYWGYNGRSSNKILAYRISRDPWRLLPVADHELDCDAGTLCGPEFADVMAGPPVSALLATGSNARIRWPTRLR